MFKMLDPYKTSAEMHYEVSGWSNGGIVIHLRTPVYATAEWIYPFKMLRIKRNDIHIQSLGRTLQMLLGKGPLHVFTILIFFFASVSTYFVFPNNCRI